MCKQTENLGFEIQKKENSLHYQKTKTILTLNNFEELVLHLNVAIIRLNTKHLPDRQ